MGKPAARVTDPTIHPLPGLLTPGPGSFTVHIGSLFAWRGIPGAAVAALQSAKKTSDAAIKTAETATAAAAGTPGAPAAVAAEQATKTAASLAMSGAISGAAAAAGAASGGGTVDIHVCATPLPIPPHGPGVVIDGSKTVVINGLPACRQGDTILEALGPPNKIAMGMFTVHIGDAATSLVANGTVAEQEQLIQMVETIRASGPQGKAFIEALENSPNGTQLFIGTSATRADGSVVNLASTGGGVTIRPTRSVSGDNEVHVDPTNLINYTATDGTTVTETPEGLLAHEMGHAKLLNDGDPAQTTGGPAAEANVRTETNPIRQELGMKPER